MDAASIIKAHYSKIGAKGGRSGTGVSKRREGSADNLRKYWAEVKAGLREPPARMGRPSRRVRPVLTGGGGPPVSSEEHVLGSSSGDVASDPMENAVELIARMRAAAAAARTPRKVSSVPGRNDPCPCGSGKKFKKCCGV